MNSLSEKKILAINPDIFSTSSFRNKKTRKTNNSSERGESRIVPNRTLKHLKKEAYRKIREHQQRIEEKMSGEGKNFIETEPLNLVKDETDFIDTVQYLESLGKEMQQKKMSLSAKQSPSSSQSSFNHTIRERTKNPNITSFSHDLEDIIFHTPTSTLPSTSYNIPMPEPSYGVLKGGKKPTYRTWKNATARANLNPHQGPGQRYKSILPPTERELKLEQIKQKIKMNQSLGPVYTENISESTMIHPSISIDDNYSVFPEKNILNTTMVSDKDLHKHQNYRYTKRKKTYHRTFNVGKQTDGTNTVGVYVANRKTRSEWQTKLQQIKQTPIQQIKKELMEQKLLKAGATVPNDVIRVIYENSLLAGNLQNHNESVVLHNFLNEET